MEFLKRGDEVTCPRIITHSGVADVAPAASAGSAAEPDGARNVPTWRKLLLEHHFNSQLSATLVPRSATTARSLAAALSAATASAAEGAAHTYSFRGSLRALIQREFIDKYVRTGSFYAVSTSAQLDHGCSVAVYPPGILHLVLDRPAYLTLGLEAARPCGRARSSGPGRARRRKEDDRYDVEVDLLRDDFKPGQAVYDRVSWCLGEGRVPHAAMAVMFVDARTGRPVPVDANVFNGLATLTRVGTDAGAGSGSAAAAAAGAAGATAATPSAAVDALKGTLPAPIPVPSAEALCAHVDSLLGSAAAGLELDPAAAGAAAGGAAAMTDGEGDAAASGDVDDEDDGFLKFGDDDGEDEEDEEDDDEGDIDIGIAVAGGSNAGETKDAFARAAAGGAETPAAPTPSRVLDDVMDWLGVLQLRLVPLLAALAASAAAPAAGGGGAGAHGGSEPGRVGSFVKALALSREIRMVPASKLVSAPASIMVKGLVSSVDALRVVDAVRAAVDGVDEGAGAVAAWGAVTLWGVADAPVGWGGKRHGHSGGVGAGEGDNSVTVIVLPNRRYAVVAVTDGRSEMM